MRDLVESRIEELNEEINSAQRREEINHLTSIKRELESLVAEHDEELEVSAEPFQTDEQLAAEAEILSSSEEE